MKAAEKLNKKLGKSFLYMGSTILIQNYQVQQDKVQVITDKRDYNFTEAALEKFILDLQVVDNESSTPAQVSQAGAILNNSGLSELQKILMDNIKKVQADKDYIPQASEIQSQVKTYIDLAKVQIDCVKVMQGRS